MNYRLIFCVLVLLMGIIAVPVSAGLTKIDAGAPVYVGEMGLDISTALNGCNQISWWPAGNDTSSPAGKVIEITQNRFSYNISPELFSGYEGTWYCSDKKPVYKAFTVEKPWFTLKIWDVDLDKDMSGQSVPRSTQVTYRIDTNLNRAFNNLYRPLVNPLDQLFDVRLKGPNGAGISNIFTGSAGAPGTEILSFDSKPDVRTSPFIWRDGKVWNHTARSGDGTPLYPPGTYTFTGTQNLNNMKNYYGDLVGVTVSGPVNITFIADVATPAPTATLSQLVITPEPSLPATTVATLAPTRAVTTVTKKPTWTSAPLPEWVTFMALGMGCMVFVLYRRDNR
ncbi:MAG: DUF3821 domain-containing protein [Methanoregula sp.]|nr:MAG: DUF3821 domain-containing protein [Methanoregula sp.]